MSRLRRKNFGAGRPKSSIQRLRNTAMPRSGRPAISASMSTGSVGRGAMANLSGLTRTGDAGFLTRGQTVDALAIDLFGLKLERHFLADSSCEEPAYRMALPAGCLHHCLDGCTLRPLQQRDDAVLLRGSAFFLRARLRGLALALTFRRSALHPSSFARSHDWS